MGRLCVTLVGQFEIYCSIIKPALHNAKYDLLHVSDKLFQRFCCPSILCVVIMFKYIFCYFYLIYFVFALSAVYKPAKYVYNTVESYHWGLYVHGGGHFRIWLLFFF
jgi:hypothetical protein